MKSELSEHLPALLEALKEELQEYGEMLALLEQQQAAAIQHTPEEVLRGAVSIQVQMARLKMAQEKRTSCQSNVAVALGKTGQCDFVELIPMLPETHGVAVETLVRENRQLLLKVQKKARQNHLLMVRSLQLMQQFMQALLPSPGTATYNGGGQVQVAASAGSMLNEAVG
jgi:flagellar biosynthesis/type III secretory pathway chaperone